jgi:hypothetical protein
VAVNKKTETPPAEALGEIRDVVGRAQRGDWGAVPRLRELLDTQPLLWRQYGDLAVQVEAAWVSHAAGDNLLLRECLFRRAAALRQELAGPDPRPVEWLLAGRVVACWLQVHYFDGLEAQALGKDEPPRLAAYRARRQAQAQRSYLAAIAMLTALRRLLPATAAPPAVPAAAAPETAPAGNAGPSKGGRRRTGRAADGRTPARESDPNNRIADLPASFAMWGTTSVYDLPCW